MVGPRSNRCPPCVIDDPRPPGIQPVDHRHPPALGAPAASPRQGRPARADDDGARKDVAVRGMGASGSGRLLHGMCPYFKIYNLCVTFQPDFPFLPIPGISDNQVDTCDRSHHADRHTLSLFRFDSRRPALGAGPDGRWRGWRCGGCRGCSSGSSAARARAKGSPRAPTPPSGRSCRSGTTEAAATGGIAPPPSPLARPGGRTWTCSGALFRAGAMVGAHPFAPSPWRAPAAGPVAALTRATLSPAARAAVLGAGARHFGRIGADPNVMFKIGIGEVPLLHQVTFSIWPDAAHGRFCPHRPPCRGHPRRARPKAGSEELYARFRRHPATAGTLGGRSPGPLRDRRPHDSPFPSPPSSARTR
jgi:hypothetical protein